MKTYTLFLLIVLFVTYSCVQDKHPKTIHFKLNMKQIHSISNVGIRGNTSPLSWNETLLLTDVNGDSIYEGDIQLNSASYDIEFKFVNQDTIFELQDQPNRSIRFEYKPEKIIYEATFNNPNSEISKTK